MKKFKLHQFDPTIYPMKLWIAEGGSKTDIAEVFLDKDNDPLCVTPDTLTNSLALTFNYVCHVESNKIGVLVWLLSNSVDVEIITHEDVHVASAIFKNIGSRVETDNDEPFAYLVGFAADCIRQVSTHKFRE